MPLIELHDAAIYYRIDGEGPACLFAHGRASTHLSWAQQIPFFSSSYTCITYDIRGFGYSTAPPGDSGLYAHRDDLERLLDELNIDLTYIVAQSMGGFGALQFALDNPGRVKALALTSTPAGIQDAVVVNAVRSSREAARGLSTEQRVFRPEWRLNHPDLLHIWLCQQATSPNYPETFLAPLWEGGGPSPDQLVDFMVPTLVIAAEHDTSVPEPAARRVAEIIPRAEFELVPDCGHCVYWEKPEVYNAVITKFFERHA